MRTFWNGGIDYPCAKLQSKCPPKQRQTWVGGLFGLLMTTGAIATAPSPSAAQTPPDPVIQVGIVQRFGQRPTDEMTIEPPAGDRLTLRFKTNGQTEAVATNRPIKISIVQEALPEPQVVERVVLSTHRSFESAEDSANQWRSRGIEVEIAQPRQWQVWAKRDTYSSPLLRRLLMKNLQAQGARTAFLDSQVQQQTPQAVFIVNGYRYSRDELEILPSGQRTFVQQGNQRSERRLYAGTLRLQPNAYGTYTLVNPVSIETYLRGVVPHEIGVGAPPTAIEAQAILARTYALRNLRRFAIDNYELCADTQCQVYYGLGGAVAETDRAIRATRGQVLTYQNELIDALYSSTTGGVTAAFSDVWNGPDRPYLKSVVDSVQGAWDLSRRPLSDEANFRAFINLRQGFNEVGWRTFRWRTEGNLNTIAADLKQYLQSKQHPLANFTRVENLQVVERALSGRVQKLAVQTDRGTVQLEKDEVLRALSTPNSTLFYLEPLYAPAPTASPGTAPASPSARTLKGYAFVGGGLGHAVGMSQTGSYKLGRLNWSASRILSFYYPGAQLQPLSQAIVYWRDPAETQERQAETR